MNLPRKGHIIDNVWGLHMCRTGTGGISLREDGDREYWERKLELEGNLGPRLKSGAV